MNVNVTVNAEILVIDVCNFTAASPDESSTSDIATSGSLISIVGQLSNYNFFKCIRTKLFNFIKH